MKKPSGKKVVLLAARAAQKSYSPYSRFPVGAALVTVKGDIFVGCNVENASYGLTLCAERVAVMKAVSEGHHHFEVLMVVGGHGEGVRPCGACLQVLAEFCGPDFPILLAPLNDLEKGAVFLLGELLPHAFALKKKSGIRRPKSK